MNRYHSTNGQIFVCQQCQKIHLELSNFAIDFSSTERLELFLKFLLGIDGKLVEEINQKSVYRRKIMVQMPGSEMKMLFTLDEFDEVRNLISSFLYQKRKKKSSAVLVKIGEKSLENSYLN